MSGTSAEATVTLHPVRDARLVPYALFAFGGLAAALLTSEPGLVALALPFAIALALGLRRHGPIEVRARVELDADRILEGDTVDAVVTLEWDGEFDAQLRLHRLGGLAHADPDDAGTRHFPAARGGLRRQLRLTAVRWGRHRMAEVWLRLEAPFGLVTWTGRVLHGPDLRILPGREGLRRLLDPADSRAVWGMHRAHTLGDGHEFAELRPYGPGDRLRDLNWAATARRGSPFVNRYHPELAGEVILALDAFADGSDVANDALSQAARAAWALASMHLRANDRVGIVGFGGSMRWLPPDGGRRAGYRILETLLGIGRDAAAAERAPGGALRPSIPGSALVIAMTPLHDPATLDILAGWRLRGRMVSVLLMDASGSMGPPADRAEALARRIWQLEISSRVAALGRVGIPVVPVPTDGSISPAITVLRNARRAPAVRGVR